MMEGERRQRIVAEGRARRARAAEKWVMARLENFTRGLTNAGTPADEIERLANEMRTRLQAERG